METIAHICIAAGFVLYMIGGFIGLIRNPKAMNDQYRSMLDPVRTNLPKDAGTAMDRAIWNDRKARGLIISGLALVIIGFVTLNFAKPDVGSAKVDEPVGLPRTNQ